MKTKNTNSLPAKVENIENQNQNQNTLAPVMEPAPTETPAPETPEQEQEQQEPAPVKVLKPKVWNFKLKEGWKDNPIDFIPSGLAGIEGAQITMQRNLRLGSAQTDRTVYDCVIIVSGYQFTFVGGDSTQIKGYIKKTMDAVHGDVNIQVRGKHTIVTKGCKSEEDVTNMVDSFVYRLAAAVSGVNKILAEAGDFAIGVTPDVYAECIREKGQAELAAHRAKLAEDERKQARKNLRDASDEEKDLAASVIGMDDWQKRMTAATAANDYTAIAALLAEKQNSETAA